MWNQKNSAILFIVGCSIVCPTVFQAGAACDHAYWFPHYFTFNQPSHEPAPAVITQAIGESLMKNNEEIPTINVTVTRVREDFNLTLLAIPMDKDDCPPRINETFDLHQFFNTCIVFQKGDEKQETIFDYIFSGCYYVLMTNATRVSWQSEPKFHNTTYRYRNTKIEYDEPKITPENGLKTMTLETTLNIPMDCMKVMAYIYELKGTLVINNKDTVKDEIVRRKILWSQRCQFSPNGSVGSDSCSTTKATTNLTFSVKNSRTVVVTWSNLRRGGGVYYLRFHGTTRDCYGPDNIHYCHITSWRPLVGDIFIPIGFRNDTMKVTDKSDSSEFYLSVTLYVMLGATIIAVLGYFILKYFRVKRPVHEKAKFKELLQIEPVIDEVELKQILLIYAKGSPEFMETMNSLRYRLKQECDCEVHDVYSPEEFGMIANLSVHGWVKRLLIDRSKVVWVDTPQLRSRFNGKQKQGTWSDCRDAAIPYAVELVTNLFPNPTTQYIYHFVVRVEGFEVEDGSDDDPLRIISPHTRYSIPLHITHLCRDLTKASESLEDTKGTVHLMNL